MPTDLVDRINASLRDEATRRESSGEEVSYALFAGRHRRSKRGVLLRVAAGFSVLLVLGGAEVVRDMDQHTVSGFFGIAQGAVTPDSSASPAVAQQDSQTPAGLIDAGGRAAAEDPSDPHRTPRKTRAEQSVVLGPSSFHMSSTAYTPTALRAQARRLATEPPAPWQPADDPSAAVGSIGTSSGLSSCLRALGLPPQARAIVDFGTYDGKPVAIIVTRSGSDDRVHVVRRGCAEGSPELVTGPYAL